MIGQTIQNYRITAHLGEGGMGTVYKATDSMLGRDVALKMLHTPLLNQPQFLERFKKEARVLAQLLHPNIALIYNFIQQDKDHFMVMEYVHGKNLEQLVKQAGTVSYQTIAAIFSQALEGLHHAHKKGIFHRDIKPSNLMLTPDGTVKLMDFGIAIMAGEQRLTQVNRVVGTLEFMSPELIQGKEPSVASDIYAVGVTMYELLTGKLPFEGNTDYNLMQDILKKKPPPVEKLNTSVPKPLAQIIMKSLEKKPEYRYASAKAFQQALWNTFPAVKDADLSLAAVTISAPVTQYVQISTKGQNILQQTKLASRETNTENKFFASLKTWRLLVAAPSRRNFIKLGGFMLLLLSVMMLRMYLGQKAVVPEQTSAANLPAARADIPVNEAHQNIRYPSEQTTNLSIVGNNHTDSVIADKKDDLPKQESRTQERTAEKERKKKEAAPQLKKADIKQEQVHQEPVVQPVVKKEEPPPVAIYTPKRIRLSDRVPVDLYLTEALDAATAQEGQILRFSVSSAVSYDGETIIETGALATGRIRNKGNKKMSVVLLSVRAKNGQQLPFQQAELSGRIDDMLRTRNYSVFLKRGTILNF